MDRGRSLAIGRGMPDKFGMRLGALILAGGRSLRMGRPKEFLPFGCETMLGRAARLLAAACQPVLVVARDADQPLPPLPATCERLADERPDAGPLAGLVLGMQRLRHQHGFDDDDAVLLTGCDLPWLSAAAVHWLLQRLGDADLVMPQAAGTLHPLAAIYRLRTLAAARAAADAGAGTPRALLATSRATILDEPALRAFDPDLRFLTNINTPAEHAAAGAALPTWPRHRP
jgi:molybdenum cofactor guanylyltransferase